MSPHYAHHPPSRYTIGLHKYDRYFISRLDDNGLYIMLMNSHLGNGRPTSMAALGGRGVSQSMIDMSGVGRGNHMMLNKWEVG